MYLFLCEACCLYCLYCRLNHLSSHANIVQRVKSCYKIKIDFRDLSCCFCGVLLRCCPPIIYKKSLFSTPTEPLLVWKRGSFVRQQRLYWSVKEALLQPNDACFAPSFIAHLSSQLHNQLYVSILSLHAQNSRISHQRFCCALSS